MFKFFQVFIFSYIYSEIIVFQLGNKLFPDQILYLAANISESLTASWSCVRIMQNVV